MAGLVAELDLTIEKRLTYWLARGRNVHCGHGTIDEHLSGLGRRGRYPTVEKHHC